MRSFLVILILLGNCSKPPETRRSPWLYPTRRPSERELLPPPLQDSEAGTWQSGTQFEPWQGESSSPDTLILKWPVPATAITSLYGPRADPLKNQNSYHYGVDLECPYGTVIIAAASGTVIKAGWNKGHGRQVVIKHKKKFRTVYSHLSQILVTVNDQVTQGQAIGRVGNSGRSTGPHLHLEILKNRTHVDPLNYLDTPLR